MEIQCAACGYTVKMRLNDRGELKCPVCRANLLGRLTARELKIGRNIDPRPHLAPYIIVGVLLIAGALTWAWIFISNREAKKHGPHPATTEVQHKTGN